MPRISKQAQAARQYSDQLNKAYRALARSPNGKLVLADLEKKFYDVDMTSSDEHSSSIKVGRHSVVLYIKRRIASGEEK